MHIAAALKKPVVSVWGSTVPEFGMYAYFPKGLEHLSKIVQVENLPCRPCSKLGYDECPKKHFECMNRINYDNIADSSETFIV
jgi:ADP-heptose:LPS heptosyltransferase